MNIELSDCWTVEFLDCQLQNIMPTISSSASEFVKTNIILTNKFSPPTGGFFLAPAEAWRALRAQRWIWRTDGQTDGRTTGLWELDNKKKKILCFIFFSVIWHGIAHMLQVVWIPIPAQKLLLSLPWPPHKHFIPSHNPPSTKTNWSVKFS